MSIDKLIHDTYYDRAGYGSIQYTLKEAKKKNPNVTLEDVKLWYATNLEPVKKLKGYNSFVAPRPDYEYQVDLFFINEPGDYKIGMIMVDIFTKYTVAVPVVSKHDSSVFDALVSCFKQMGAFPEIVYSDNEPALSSNEVKQYFKEHNINHIITLSHAYVAERGVRTLKDAIYKRLKRNPDLKWYDLLYEILLKYNRLSVHNTTGFTPVDAKKEKNLLAVKMNLELKRRRNRSYPEIQVGDKVKIYKKKKTFDKENISVWSENRYTVEEITEKHGQPFYKLTLYDRPLMRSELLKV